MLEKKFIKDILLCLPVPPNVKESVKCSFLGQTNMDVLAARMESVRVIVNILPQNSSAIRERHMMATYSTHTKTKVQQNGIYYYITAIRPFRLFTCSSQTILPIFMKKLLPVYKNNLQFPLPRQGDRSKRDGVRVMRFGVVHSCHFFSKRTYFVLPGTCSKLN